MELRDFSTSMIDISQRASTSYTNLSTRMDPTQVVEILTTNTKLQKATQDIQRDSNLMKLGTTETAKCNYANLTLDHEYLLEEVMEHEDYLSAEDHVIIQGMEQREEWKEMMNKITRELLHLTTTITSHSIPSAIIDIHTIENKVNTLQALLLEKIKTIEMADREQCLFFDLPTSSHPLKIPTFSGTFSKDFKAFERNFNEAAKDNKVSRTDQPGVLKSALRGNAKKYIFLGHEMSIDHAWAKLNDAYGDPQKGTYRWTPDQRRRLLEGSEHKDNINTPQDVHQQQEDDLETPQDVPQQQEDDLETPQDVPQQQGTRSQTTPRGTQTNPGPRETTTSTQTKNTNPKRPRHRFKYKGHHQTRHKSSITKKKWSPRQGPTLSRINFLCTMVLHQKTNRPRLTAILELRSTTLQARLQPPTTSTTQDITTQTITSGLCKSKSLRDEKQGLSTNLNNINVTQQEKENGNRGINTKHSPPNFRMENLEKQPRPKRTGRNIRPHPCNYKCLNRRWTPKPRKRGTKNTKPCYVKSFSRPLTLSKSRENQTQCSPRCETTPRNSNLAKGLALALTLLTARYTTQGMTSLTRGMELWAPAINTCPPIFGPPPVPPNLRLARGAMPWGLPRPPETNTWASQLASWLRRTCMTWYKKIFVPAPQARGPPLTRDDN